MASWSQERTLLFIDYYRSHECLWKVRSKDYSNKMKRERAYDDMTDFVRTFYPNANKDTVVNKISNLRGSWRKEHKKVTSSQVSGAGEDEVYEPTLFYYDYLSFIKSSDSEAPRQGREIGDARNFDSHEPDQDDDSREQMFDSLDCDVDVADDQNSEASSLNTYTVTQGTPGPSTRLPTRENPSQKRYGQPSTKRQKTSEEDDLLTLACQKLKDPRLDSPPKDEFDAFGQSIAHDLRSMSRQQFIHAKKLISDVIYEGQLETLSRSSSVVPVHDSYGSAGPPHPRTAADSACDTPTRPITGSSAGQFSSSGPGMPRNYPFKTESPDHQ